MDSAFPVFQPESPQAEAIFDLFMLVLFISAGIFLIVTGLIVIALVRGRQKLETPEQDFGSEKKEIFWMVGPTIIVLWIGAISAKLILTMNAVPVAHPDRGADADIDLVVIGHQWWWEVQYPDGQQVGANEVHIPVGKKIRIQLQSADVIHCFWVPQLARKMDAIPGRDNYIWIEANREGEYQGRCAEFCGTQHTWMNFKVYAHSPADYEQWLANRQQPPAEPTEGDALAGKQLFFEQTCSNCHAIAGTQATANIGPNLTFIGRRGEIGGGVIENSTENLTRWMTNAQAIKPGCKMPNFNFDPQQVRHLVAYLESLR